MSHTTIITGDPVARFSGPPADRMNGRPSRQANAQARAQGNYNPKTKAAAAMLSADQALDQAILQGVIGANMAAHYRVLWQADPKGTREYLEKIGLHPNLGEDPQINSPEHIAASADAYPTSALSGAEQKRIAAAREGRGPGRIVQGGL
jgi:hypothetical protein